MTFLYYTTTSHKSNPSSKPKGVVDSYSTLGHVQVVTGVEGCLYAHWLTGLWSTQAKVEGTVPKAAWHWGNDSSVVNDPLGEPGRTALYVGFLSTWDSVFFPIL
jgi:hypothetical protein